VTVDIEKTIAAELIMEFDDAFDMSISDLEAENKQAGDREIDYIEIGSNQS